MNIVILGGFLGSGKTTLLMKLVKAMAEGRIYTKPVKVVIIENEIGSEGVDDKLLKRSGYQVKDMFGGCTCCTMGSELITTVQEIEGDMNPDWMILETTGLAYPGLIQDNLKEALGKESRICTVVDVKRWKRLKAAMEELLESQLECADVVLLNKTDLAEAEEIESVEKDIREMNPSAILYRTSEENEIQEKVWKMILGKEEA